MKYCSVASRTGVSEKEEKDERPPLPVRDVRPPLPVKLSKRPGSVWGLGVGRKCSEGKSGGRGEGTQEPWGGQPVLNPGQESRLPQLSRNKSPSPSRRCDTSPSRRCDTSPSRRCVSRVYICWSPTPPSSPKPYKRTPSLSTPSVLRKAAQPPLATPDEVFCFVPPFTPTPWPEVPHRPPRCPRKAQHPPVSILKTPGLQSSGRRRGKHVEFLECLHEDLDNRRP